MDVEAVVARRLSKAVGAPAFLEVPEDSPASFIVVEQTGGYGEALETVALSIDCWAGKLQRKQARALAEKVSAAIPDLDIEPNIFGPAVESIYRQNDPDTGRSRYIVQMQLNICE